jgi:hypothetical protein
MPPPAVCSRSVEYPLALLRACRSDARAQHSRHEPALQRRPFVRHGFWIIVCK